MFAPHPPAPRCSKRLRTKRSRLHFDLSWQAARATTSKLSHQMSSSLTRKQQQVSVLQELMLRGACFVDL